MSSGTTEKAKVAYQELTKEETCKKLGVDPFFGLSEEEVNKRREIYGYNELDQEEEETIWDKIMEQFEDRFVRLLLLAAIISFTVSIIGGGDTDELPAWVEPSVIVAILIANGFIGIYQDYNADKATQALRKLQSLEDLVLRDGKWIKIKSNEIVPGDIVRVTTGDMIPADCRVIKMHSLSLMVNQAPLTGETKEINKYDDPCSGKDIQGKINICFSGTLVVFGSAELVALSTGMDTEIGEIQKLNQQAKEDTDDEKTPLGEKLDGFGEFLEKAIFWICVVIWIINIRNFWDPMLGGPIKGALYYFKIAVALAVAAIPEGLPAVITTCLALGTRRMTANNAIIKKLPSVETLGCTTVICSDKTGTLTLNQMAATKFMLFGSDPSDIIVSEVETDSYSPIGKINNKVASELKSYVNAKLFAEIACVNTTSKLGYKDNKYEVMGTATEGAILSLGGKMSQFFGEGKTGLDYINYLQEQYILKNINSFDAKRKMMSVLVRRNGQNENSLFIKGAPEKILDSASTLMLKDGSLKQLNNSDKDKIDNQIRELTKQGLRVLAFGVKTDIGDLKTFAGISDKSHPSFKILQDPSNYATIEEKLTLVGLVCIRDLVRPEVPQAIKECSMAGISVFMVTGDNKETAVAVGKSCGIINEQNAVKNTLEGMEFEKMLNETPELLKQKLKEVIKKTEGMVFARTAPKHKQDLVKVLKSLDQIVAMTGDGVNDSPALVQANIGIAMGITGTEVAKDCASMILMDDNFATIVKAVEEGRGIYENMKAFIRYMISSNIGEVISIFLSSMLGIPDGFNSIQLLWVNLVTDGIPAMALSFNPPDKDVMVKPPRSNEDGIVDVWVLIRYMTVGLYIGIATVGVFLYWYMIFEGDGHSLLSFGQLSSWTKCNNWEGFTVNNFAHFDFTKDPCSYFTIGKAKASTLSLSVLVMIEMFNAFNAISENQSLLSTGIMINPYLIVGVLSSVLLHCVIIYIPSLNFLFSTMPLNFTEWMLVIGFSFPVIIIDEILKVISRKKLADDIERRLKAKMN